MLSVLDLLAAGSLSLEMGAFLLQRVHSGASFLTAAQPGGAGKTAVMGALLALTPPGAALREITGLDDISPPAPTFAPTWHVCHELGSGRVSGYLWGQALAEYFELLGPDSHLASNLHADTLSEVQAALGGAPNHLSTQTLGQVDLLLTLRVEQNGEERRYRVAEVWSSDGTEQALAYRWDATRDTFDRGPAAPPAAELAAETEFLASLHSRGLRELPDFRRELLAWRGV